MMRLKIKQLHDETQVPQTRLRLSRAVSSWIHVFACCVLLLAYMAESPFAAAVELRDSDQVTLHPTAATEITLTGQNLRSESGEVAALWCSSPVTIEILDPENKDRNRVRYRLTPTHPLGGVITIRAYTADSVSQALLFFVSSPASQSIPTEADAPLKPPFGIDLKSQGNGETTIRFECEKGQQFFAEIVGSRIGSPVDGVLILSDQDKRELTFADDHPITGSDPVLKWTATYSGIHHLTIKDVEYRGGLRMHLRVSETPTVGRTIPAAIRRGETRRVRATTDSKAEPLCEQVMHVGMGEAPGLGFIPQSSVLSTFIKSDQPVYTEMGSEQIPVPALFCGKITTADEVDRITFDARKGETLTLNFLSTDGPFVGDLRLFRNDQKVRDHHFGRDPNSSLKYTVTETDTYRIEIREVLQRSGIGFEYCVSIRNDLSPTTLRIASVKQGDRRIRNDKPHRQVWFNDETLPVLLRADRRGFNGPITLHAELDGKPCQVDGSIEEKKNEAEVQIHLPHPVPNRELKRLRIFGRCEIADHQMHIPLDLSEHIKRDFEEFTTIPANVANTITVLVTPHTGKKE
jgi:hypothetical protein